MMETQKRIIVSSNVCVIENSDEIHKLREIKLKKE